MDCVYLVNTQKIFELREAPFDTELVAYLIEVLFVPLTNCITLSIGMSLVNWDEFGAKTKPNYSYVYLLHRLFLLSGPSKRAPLCI